MRPGEKKFKLLRSKNLTVNLLQVKIGMEYSYWGSGVSGGIVSITWASSHSIHDRCADPSTAAGELQAALDFFLEKPEYSEALGLVQSLNLEAVLGNTPAQVVTVFLPTNNALMDPASRPFIDRVFAQNKVNEVGLYHVVPGYYDLNAIVTSKPRS